MGYKDLKFPENSLFLVTGGAGFIGSNISEALLKMGYRVRCLDNFSTGKRENIESFLTNPNYEIIMFDVGQGDSFFIKLPHGSGNILIDCYNNVDKYLK